MKKFFVIFVVLCLVFSFTACDKTNISSDNSSDTSDNNSTSSQTEEATKQVRSEKVTKIYSVEYGEKYDKSNYLQDVFYDEQNGNTLPYCLYLPRDYSPSKKYPVILFLHGAGEKGTDNVRQLNNIGNMFEYNGDIVSEAFILCPQSSEWWNLDRSQYNDYGGTLGSAVHLLKDIMQKYSCDSNRVYVTGLSMGGYATWDLLERCGNLFAAGVPICGGGNSENGAAYINIPIKIYHGTADTTVSYASSERMYHAIVLAGGQKVEMISLEGYGHNAWDYAYADREMFCWMFSQNKSGKLNAGYENNERFSIKDASGKTIITNRNVVKTSYSRDVNKKGNMIIEFELTTEGFNKLNKAYNSSNGSEFTFYYGTQKVYSFTVSMPLKDKVFCIADVFTVDDYFEFYTATKIYSKKS